ncbi:unnamed protein product [Fusarium graminearum]|uniref:Chromosome 3, complete genome n=1 Tax=Gibberella zeae (strain ATCC MYA-4620 / CBS 123657 / FGSC 9075 / NRRL 31084 / PH-1) TaxID=229533 RepID=A0A098E044_GIBZE|nr:unnamed protein product [Fusarium graminearum]
MLNWNSIWGRSEWSKVVNTLDHFGPALDICPTKLYIQRFLDTRHKPRSCTPQRSRLSSCLLAQFCPQSPFHERRIIRYDTIVDQNEQSPSEDLDLSYIEKDVASKIKVSTIETIAEKGEGTTNQRPPANSQSI